MNSSALNIHPNVWKITIVILFTSLFTTNPWYTFISLLVVPIVTKLLWRKDEIPILFFAIMMQWIQIVIKIFQADFEGKELTDVFIYSEKIESTIILSLLAILSLTLGMSHSSKGIKKINRLSLLDQAKNYNNFRTTIVYLISIVVVVFLTRYSFFFGGLQQFIVKLSEFKWSIFFIFYVITFTRKTDKKYFFIILGAEVMLAFTGFFSNFKEFFLIVIMCFIFIQQKLSLKSYILIAITIIFVFNLMVVWQFVKGDYRTYLSGGEKSQSVKVDTQDALLKLSLLVSDFEFNDYNEGLDQLIDRASYIDFFSATQSNVPREVPYENGKLWENAITHILTPRIFFPNKAIIDDSEKTKKYTGLNFAGADQGASISLGYVAESYVDYGIYLMFMPIYLLGLTIGWVYKFIMSNSYNQIWGSALSVPIFFQINAFEIALEKIIGGLIAYFLVYLILRKFFIKSMHLFLTKNIEELKYYRVIPPKPASR